ncbi:hypothetical protein DPSP01_014535 [Paraphaeosphaeria sporulosa]
MNNKGIHQSYTDDSEVESKPLDSIHDSPPPKVCPGVGDSLEEFVNSTFTLTYRNMAGIVEAMSAGHKAIAASHENICLLLPSDRPLRGSADVAQRSDSGDGSPAAKGSLAPMKRKAGFNGPDEQENLADYNSKELQTAFHSEDK